VHEEDRQLAQRLLLGDEAAFRAFFADYFPRLFRFVLRRVDQDQEVARDVAQSALTRAVAKLHQYRGEASLFTWCCQIARHELADLHARTARERAALGSLVMREDEPEVRASLESIPADSEAEPDAVRQREELAAIVHAALDYLPPRYARVLELKYLEDLPVEAIAERLGVTAIAVQSLLARARLAFRDACSALGDSLESTDWQRPDTLAGGTR
jgi:RNA polymerase sigma-70 factor (ECF subfamily)